MLGDCRYLSNHRVVESSNVIHRGRAPLAVTLLFRGERPLGYESFKLCEGFRQFTAILSPAHLFPRNLKLPTLCAMPSDQADAAPWPGIPRAAWCCNTQYDCRTDRRQKTIHT